jgi:cell division protein FtsQ
VSALSREPFLAARPVPPPGWTVPAPPGWPNDPGLRARIGAEFDPLRDVWPALAPPVPPPPPPPPVSPAQRRLPVRTHRPVAPPPVPPEPRAPREVAPSRLAYRLHRLWLVPAVRTAVLRGVPLLVVLAALAAFWAGDERRARLIGLATELRAAIEARPEFRIARVEVVTDTPEVAAAVLAQLDVALPASSLRLDPAELRARAEALGAVERAAVTVRTTAAGDGVLEVRLTERQPAFIWRHAGGLELLDAEGRRVAQLASRAARPDLPLIAGEGAPAAVAEARALIAAAEPIAHRLQGLVRVGNRRWDVVLDREQRILLPQTGAVAALERVLALDAAQDLLARDITVVDMRHPQRPVLRLSPDAAAELARIRQMPTPTRMARR